MFCGSTFHCAISVHHIGQITAHQAIVPLHVIYTRTSPLRWVHLSRPGLVTMCIDLCLIEGTGVNRKDTEKDTEKDIEKDTEQPKSSSASELGSTYPGPSAGLMY